MYLLFLLFIAIHKNSILLKDLGYYSTKKMKFLNLKSICMDRMKNKESNPGVFKIALE